METKKLKKTKDSMQIRKRNLGKNSGSGDSCGDHHEHEWDSKKPICKLFENPEFQEICGDTLHPGGLELTEKGVRACKFRNGAKILDIGCGKGDTANYLSEKHGLDITGLDQSEILIEQAKRKYPGLHFEKGDADFLEFSSNSFDGVLMECVLSLCDLKEEVLHECWCVLKEGGKLILSDLYLREPGKKKTDENSVAAVKTCMTGGMVKEELLEILRKTGFTKIMWNDCSETLGNITANAIMKYGSLEKFWEEMLPEGVDKNAFCTSVCSGKPGYFQLTAVKAKA